MHRYLHKLILIDNIHLFTNIFILFIEILFWSENSRMILNLVANVYRKYNDETEENCTSVRTESKKRRDI